MDRRWRSHPRRPVRAPLLDDVRRLDHQHRRALGSRSVAEPIPVCTMMLWRTFTNMWHACTGRADESRTAKPASIWRDDAGSMLTTCRFHP